MGTFCGGAGIIREATEIRPPKGPAGRTVVHSPLVPTAGAAAQRGASWLGDAVLKKSLCLVSLGAFCFTCGGCAYNGPAAPSFAAMPGPNKSYESFQGDDQYCQTSAQQAIGYQSPGQAANDAAVGGAAVGTALGALAGAAIGSAAGHVGQGAALGAGT